MSRLGSEQSSVPGVFNQVVEKLLIDNPMAFPPKEDDCDPPVPPGVPRQCCEDNWRIVKGACWQTLIDTGVGESKSKSKDKVQTAGDDLMKPCIDEICCLDRYEVCITEENGEWVKTITHTTPPSPQEDCDPPTYSSQCWPACGHGARQ